MSPSGVSFSGKKVTDPKFAKFSSMEKKGTHSGRTIFFWGICLLAVAVVIRGLSSYLLDLRLVGRKVLPNFNPDDVATIQIDGIAVVSKVDGHWLIGPFDGYPANDDLIMHNLRAIADMAVCAVERNSRRKLQIMEKKHEVAFLDKEGSILGIVVLGDIHLDVKEGFVDTIVKRDGRYLELNGEVVLVKPVLLPFSGWCCDWITAPVLMMPDDVYAMHWQNRYAPVQSIDYKFDGAVFRMEKNSAGKLDLKYAEGAEELLRWEPSYRFRVSFQRIESFDHFQKRHMDEHMSSGHLTICTTDGTNSYSRTANLYRGADDTCYVLLGDWVYVKESWDSRTWFPPRKMGIKGELRGQTL